MILIFPSIPLEFGLDFTLDHYFRFSTTKFVFSLIGEFNFLTYLLFFRVMRHLDLG